MKYLNSEEAKDIRGLGFVVGGRDSRFEHIMIRSSEYQCFYRIDGETHSGIELIHNYWNWYIPTSDVDIKEYTDELINFKDTLTMNGFGGSDKERCRLESIEILDKILGALI